MTLNEIKNFFKNDNFAMGLGCNIELAEHGHSVVTVDIDERHLNGNKVVQGGVMFTLADFACAVAANADEIAFVSADGAISYLSAGTGKRLIADANVIKSGRTLAFCEATITDETSKIIAKASFTMCRAKS